MTNFTTSTPHDALFKSFLMYRHRAGFYGDPLTQDLRELCDLDSSTGIRQLRPLKNCGRYIPIFSWSVKTREGDGLFMW